MNPDEWLARCSELLSQRRSRALLRRRQVVHPLDAVHVEIDGRRFINFASNNYLGLTHHPHVVEAMRAASAAGGGAAGLISGYTDVHARCEAEIARWKGVESAVILPSGYQANLAAVQTLAAIGQGFPRGARFLFDKLCHASLIDAVAAVKAPMRVFPHNGIAKLQRLLEEADREQMQVVLTESVFSMDGDAADLPAIAKLKESHPFVLLADEAHGSGVYGPNGAGLAAELGLQSAVDVSIVTLSKAIGCGGGAVCGSALFRDALLNFGRAYVYSTIIPPASAAAVIAAIEVMRAEPQRQQRLRELAARVRERLAIPSGATTLGDSPIIPILLGSEQAALKAADRLREENLLVIAVRPPTVPPGGSRLRVTLSCEHSDDEIEQLVQRLLALS